MAKTFSGKMVIKILCRFFGFSFISQKGSHVKLRKEVQGNILTAIIPLHKELMRGTLKGILQLAGIDEDEFISKSRGK